MHTSPILKPDDGKPTDKAKKRQQRSFIFCLGLSIFACVALVVFTSLSATRWYLLPSPTLNNSILSQAVENQRTSKDLNKWFAVHFIYSQCACSEEILESIIARKLPEHVHEKIIFVGHNSRMREKAALADVAFEEIQASQLKNQFNIITAPLLVIASPSNEIAYAGTYNDRSNNQVVNDLRIINAISQNKPARKQTLFGCSESKDLATNLNAMRFNTSLL